MPIVATPNATTGGVQLVLTAPTTHRLRALTRVDANGTASVRLLAGQGLSGGSLAVVDHEAALVGAVLYRAYTVPTSGGVVRPTEHAATTTLAGLRRRDRIASATRPATGVSPLLVTALEAVRPHASVVHEIIDRPDPLVSPGVQGLRRGALRILCDTYADARALEAVMASGDTMLWRQTEYTGMDMYFTALQVGSVVEEPMTSPRRWSTTIQYVEQLPPTSPVLGALGWTVAQLAGSGLQVSTVLTRYATVTALTIGPTT